MGAPSSLLRGWGTDRQSECESRAPHHPRTTRLRLWLVQSPRPNVRATSKNRSLTVAALYRPPVCHCSVSSVFRRRAITLVEAIMSIVLVGGLVLMALNTVGSAAVAQARTGDSGRGQLLALALMSEIMKTSYADPESPGKVFGPEADEITATRKYFDDVDDYQDWKESPLVDSAGTAIPDLPSDWARTVNVQYANTSNLKISAVTDTGIKRIIVTVFHRGQTVANLVALRTGDAVGPGTIIVAPVDPETLQVKQGNQIQ